jgi:carbamate kinase
VGETALVAIGGNSLVRAGEKGTIIEQIANTRRTARAIVSLVREGFALVVTHGNGPQVGAALLRSERASDQVYEHPLDVCVATTQGEIGFMLQMALQRELSAAGIPRMVTTVLTQVVVSPDDPAMVHPTKPIGPFYSRSDAEERHRVAGWTVVEDAGRGYRRVVPSPEPLQVVEEEVVRSLLAQGVIVVAVGGGGIPVVRGDGGYVGVEAVIDKDRASALLASRLGASLMVISTDADRVYLDFKKPTQRPLGEVRAGELREHYAAGHFPPGSMGPKIESALRFLDGGGRRVIITSYELLPEAIKGGAGTHILP